MALKDDVANLIGDANATNIQITINLAKPDEPRTAIPGNAPNSAIVRQVFLEPGANPVKKVRISLIPDDPTQNFSTDIFDANQAEPTKWRELLGDPNPATLDIDTGVVILRMNENGGTVAWLPNDGDHNPIFRPVTQKTEEEPGGVSIGSFMACFIEKGSTAAAATQCISRL